jgi:beta-galactosidase
MAHRQLSTNPPAAPTSTSAASSRGLAPFERGNWIPGTESIVFGGDYNPEQWPREVWREDVALMQEAGVNLVSIGIFSWALLEPSEGVFDFSWLDDVMDMLAAAGIGVSLGTPTASPPAWFWSAYPEARPVTRDGIPLGFGSRGMASPSSPEYAAACARITTELGRRYATHPALRIWHVHNEYGAPVSECYSDHSVLAFRDWLRARYGTLDTLNGAWGTAFWGQHYGEWAHIDAPRRAASVVNPAQRLDFARFSSHALLQCFRRERDILHELSPGIPVTTNFMATSCPAVDYWKWADEVDIVSNDHYLTAERDDNHIMLALDADMVRSLAGGRPWLLMEHSTSAVNWQPRNIAKARGELARNSMSHFARGADGIMFFQWRASRSGAEKFHSAMLPHAGADSRVFRETRDLGSVLAGLAPVLGSRVTARVALLWDWESFWAQDLEWRPSVELGHRRQVEAYYTELWKSGVTVDFAHPEADLSGYDLVIAPALYLLSDVGSANLDRYVTDGGRLVVSFFSGIVDEVDRVPRGASPGQLRHVLGLSIPEFLPLRKGEMVTLSDGTIADAWTDSIELAGATSLLDYVDGPAAGLPAVTRNTHGGGVAWYVSTRIEGAGLTDLLEPILREAGIALDPLARQGLETVTRAGDDATYSIHINHGSDDARVGNAGDGDGVTVVPAGEVRVLRHSAAARP